MFALSPDPANDPFQYRNPPEVFVEETGGGVPVGVPGTVPPFVDTGVLSASSVMRLPRKEPAGGLQIFARCCNTMHSHWGRQSSASRRQVWCRRCLFAFSARLPDKRAEDVFPVRRQ